MLNLSLRAVFRKESWMFCAGLLFSIADLLKFFELPKQLSHGPSARKGHGNSLPLRRQSKAKGRAARQVAASTIRPPRALFNPERGNRRFCSKPGKRTEI